jgi:hypothetical protein
VAKISLVDIEKYAVSDSFSDSEFAHGEEEDERFSYRDSWPF